MSDSTRDGAAPTEGEHLHLGWAINSDSPVLRAHLAGDHGIVEFGTAETDAREHMRLHMETTDGA